MMFSDKKYTGWYFSIIGRAKVQDRKKGETYYESHHITPKCMGGTNQKTNLVLLTAKEHFVCHWLLTKMVISKKHQYQMDNAFACFIQKNTKHKRILTALEYQKAREANWRAKGRKKPEGFGDKIRTALTGTKLSDDRKKKIAASMTGKLHDPEVVKRRAATNRALWGDEKKLAAGGKKMTIADVVYPSLKTASRSLGLDRLAIKRMFIKLGDQPFTQDVVNKMVARKLGPFKRA